VQGETGLTCVFVRIDIDIKDGRPADKIGAGVMMVAQGLAELAATNGSSPLQVPVDRIAFDIERAAAAVQLSVSYLTQQIHAGRLPAKMVGRRYRIGAVELREWFEGLPDAI